MVELLGKLLLLAKAAAFSGKVVEYIGGRVIRKAAAFRKGGRVYRWSSY